MSATETRPEEGWALSTEGWVSGARRVASPNCNDRPAQTVVDLLVIHNISLPPRQYGGGGVEALFTNCLDPAEHSFYADIAQLRVSAHFFIRRDGELVQFVPVYRRAWHAGVSSWKGREGCNDFSLGIELEGCDFEPFTERQYQVLTALTRLLRRHLPLTDIAGHSDIAPGRKTDPGPYFDWGRYRSALDG
jgi:N-acetyl-anhydromuramoyl-L-alanine amidase